MTIREVFLRKINFHLIRIGVSQSKTWWRIELQDYILVSCYSMCLTIFSFAVLNEKNASLTLSNHISLRCYYPQAIHAHSFVYENNKQPFFPRTIILFFGGYTMRIGTKTTPSTFHPWRGGLSWSAEK